MNKEKVDIENISSNEHLNNYIWEAFVYFFRNIKGYEDWTEDEIELSRNNGDLNEFIEYIKSVLC